MIFIFYSNFLILSYGSVTLQPKGFFIIYFLQTEILFIIKQFFLKPNSLTFSSFDVVSLLNVYLNNIDILI